MSSPQKFSESPKKVNFPTKEQSPKHQNIQKEVDQNLYSRQIGVIGLETQSKLAKQKIFIHGLGGTGKEKNLILAGPCSLVLHDNGIVTLRDLGCNFAFEEGDVGKRMRSEASIDFLKNLNEYVKVKFFFLFVKKFC